MNNKLLIKIIIINIVLAIIFLAVQEVISYKSIYQAYKGNLDSFNLSREENNKIKLQYTKTAKFNYNDYKHHFKSFIDPKNNKRPIILFGCSYSESIGIDDDSKTFMGQLGKLTHRNIFNRSVGATGTQLMYYQLSHDGIKKEIPDAEYIIYTFLDYHYSRLFNYTLCFFDSNINLRYKLNNKNKLVQIETPIPWLYSLFTVKKIQNNLVLSGMQNEERKYHPIFKNLMSESMKEARKKYPNAKFIIFVYPSGRYVKGSAVDYAPAEGENGKLPKYLEDYLKNEGFTIVYAEDLVGTKIRNLEYRQADKDHPNEKAWEVVTPALVKELKL